MRVNARIEVAGWLLPSSLSDLVALAQHAGTEGLGMLTDLAGAAARALIRLFLYFGGAYALLLDSSALVLQRANVFEEVSSRALPTSEEGSILAFDHHAGALASASR